MMAPDPPPCAGDVKTNIQLAKGVSKAGGGWQGSINNHTTMTTGDDEQQERAVNDEGSNKGGKGGKGDGDGDKGGGQQRGQGRQGPWRW
jgi:hypothetical protein